MLTYHDKEKQIAKDVFYDCLVRPEYTNVKYIKSENLFQNHALQITFNIMFV